MPCAVCNHTIQNIGHPGRRIFWCPRCGSLTEIMQTTEQAVGEDCKPCNIKREWATHEPPKLVTLSCQLIRAVEAADHTTIQSLLGVARDLATKIEHCKEALGLRGT